MALTPRWLGSLLLVLVLVTCFVGLSAWQVDRAQHKNDVTDAQNVEELKPFNDVMAAQVPMPGILADQRVSLTGHWLPDAQVVVPGRVLDGADGYWVVTMFAPDGARLGEEATLDPEGKTIAIPVLRGFTTDEATASRSRAESGPVEMIARIGPVEGPMPTADLPDGQVHTVSTSQLINLFPDVLTYSGFLIPESATGPAASVGTGGLTAVPPTTTRDEGGFDLQSAVYAAEWLIFAGMALYMWWQLLRDDFLRRRLEGTDGGSQHSGNQAEYVVVKAAGESAIDPEVMAGLTGLPAHRHGAKRRRAAGPTDDRPTEGN
ncbi:cytochrome oxidase assembly protein ShyY1 [Brevibacterium sanguinis]|uniref:SURF1-like protein n=2 Tax=Brevibacterium TaxID=1696 RepID=A0A366IMU2_9MICO|nr:MULTISPECIES: SURF1 family protein [Brevibacterium]RBP68198.1 cytochrome oxidase assembly protein ShyY1 [Brevibacterium sanguinis]RBP74385.1 cytochrome oxidase assembly protein ShyY1 [Brevibacterium celere]